MMDLKLTRVAADPGNLANVKKANLIIRQAIKYFTVRLRTYGTWIN